MTIPANEKILLSIKEAAEYSGIGQNRIERLLKEANCPFCITVGNSKRMVKRKEFEDYISKQTHI